MTSIEKRPCGSWSYDSWIYNYLCNQCRSPLTLWVWTPLRRDVLKIIWNSSFDQDDRRRRIGFWLIQIPMKKSILMKLYQLTEDHVFLLYIRGRLICQSRDCKKRQGRSISLLIHPIYNYNYYHYYYYFFIKFLEFEDHSVVDVFVRETNRYAKQHFTC